MNKERTTGRDIILAVAENMRQSLEPLAGEIVAPSFYTIHLHSDVYDHLRTILPKIDVEVKRLLDDELEHLNRGTTSFLKRLQRMLRRRWASESSTRYVNAEGNWHIRIQEDPNGSLELGDVEVISEFTNSPSTYPTTLTFGHRDDGSITVHFQATDGSWIDSGGMSRLPSGLYITTLAGVGEALGELEELINSPGVAEADLQKFFEFHPELLKGSDYSVAIPQAIISVEGKSSWRADFVFKPIHQSEFCKILELKLPRIPILRNDKNGHPQFYAQLLAAISQLRDYGEAFGSERTRSRFREAYGLEVYKPDLQLIAGRRIDLIHSTKLLELQRRNGVQITDWDTHLDKLKRKFGT